MLGQSCSALEYGVTKSTFYHERAGIRCFAMVQFGKRVGLEYYSGTLVLPICMMIRI